jgi:hypothetical protein
VGTFGPYGESVPQADLERFFFWVSPDPLEGVPTEVIDYLAEQLRIADPRV